MIERLWKMLFISSKTSFGPLNFEFFVIPSFLPKFLRFNKEVETRIIMISWNDLHQLLIIIFGITLKPLWIKASKIAILWITKERNFPFWLYIYIYIYIHIHSQRCKRKILRGHFFTDLIYVSSWAIHLPKSSYFLKVV